MIRKAFALILCIAILMPGGGEALAKGGFYGFRKNVAIAAGVKAFRKVPAAVAKSPRVRASVVKAGARQFRKGITLHLKSPGGRKLGVLQDAARSGDLKIGQIEGRTSKFARMAKEHLGPRPSPQHQADHIRDLQLGGRNVAGNSQWLHRSENASLGASIMNQLNKYPKGTRIKNVLLGILGGKP